MKSTFARNDQDLAGLILKYHQYNIFFFLNYVHHLKFCSFLTVTKRLNLSHNYLTFNTIKKKLSHTGWGLDSEYLLKI